MTHHGMAPSKTLKIGMSRFEEIQNFYLEWATKIDFPAGVRPTRCKMELLTKLGTANGRRLSAHWVQQKRLQLLPAVMADGRRLHTRLMLRPASVES